MESNDHINNTVKAAYTDRAVINWRLAMTLEGNTYVLQVFRHDLSRCKFKKRRTYDT